MKRCPATACAARTRAPSAPRARAGPGKHDQSAAARPAPAPPGNLNVGGPGRDVGTTGGLPSHEACRNPGVLPPLACLNSTSAPVENGRIRTARPSAGRRSGGHHQIQSKGKGGRCCCGPVSLCSPAEGTTIVRRVSLRRLGSRGHPEAQPPRAGPDTGQLAYHSRTVG